MLHSDRKAPETVRHLLLLEYNTQRLGKRQLAELGLDLDFPAINDADKYVVAQIINGAISYLSQTRRLIMPPQQDMGIEEQSHFSPSQKALGVGLIEIVRDHDRPLPKPGYPLTGLLLRLGLGCF